MKKTMASTASLIVVVLMVSLEAQASFFTEEWFSPLRVVDRDHVSSQKGVATILIEPGDVDVVHQASFEVNLTVRYPEEWESVNIAFDSSPRWITTRPEVITVFREEDDEEDPRSLLLAFNTTANGKATIEVMLERNGTRYGNAWLRLEVQLNSALTVTSDVLGWIYTIAWDASYLPQIILNWQRRSVSGFSFDFLVFSFLDYMLYFTFNAALLWITEIRAEYFDRNPSGFIQVRMNDVVYAFYALTCTIIQISQCFIFERAKGQRVSTTCWVLAGLMMATVVSSIIAQAIVPSFEWLDVLYVISYIKLVTTFIKYTPQLYLNYKDKSTAGWSIGNVMLDFTGGVFSLIQMFLLAANYDDWYSVLTNPAKFGLGLMSIFFNIFFFAQHFCLYREKPKGSLENAIKMKNADEMTRF